MVSSNHGALDPYSSESLEAFEAVPGLEGQYLHHEHLVHVRPAASRGIVGVHGLDDGSEPPPVYLFLSLSESVAVSGCLPVELPEEV